MVETHKNQSFNHALRNNEEIPPVTDVCSSFTRSIILFFLLPRNRSVPDDGGHQTSTSFPAKIDGFDEADIRSVCTEAGMYAIRSRRKTVTEKDFLDAVNKVIKGHQKFSATPKYMVYN
ncbi:putative proteasome endopeptidase complex [Helianthus debilis subsp. tardiflorus]